MKKIVLSFLTFCFVFLFAIDLFSIELGRGIFDGYSQNGVRIKKLSNGELLTVQYDDNTTFDLISGESVSIQAVNFYYNAPVEYIIDGTKLISLSFDFGGENGEYVVVGGMDFYNLSSQTCRVNGTRFKLDANIKYFSRGVTVSPNIIRNSDLVKVFYKKDPVNDENIATEINVVSGTYYDFKRTGIIRKFSVNEIILGDPVDPNFQEQFIVHTSSKIYDHNFESGSRSLLKVGALIDIYALYDSVYSTNLAYEIHVKDIPNNNDFYVTGRPLTASAGFLTTEFGEFNFLPTGKFTDFSGDAITLTELLQGEARYFSANVSNSNLTAIKEIPVLQTESTIDGTINKISGWINLTNGFIARLSNPGSTFNEQFMAIYQNKTFFNGHYYDNLENRTASITVRKGSKVNERANAFHETMAIEATDPVNPKFFIGMITESSGSSISINDIKLNVNGNSSFIKIDGKTGNITDFVPGNFAVLEVQPGTSLDVKTAYRFNPIEIVGRISNLQQDQITVGGNVLAAGDFTFYRGQGNQVTEQDKILPNSIVKVLSLHGAAEAITKFTGKGFPTTATVGTIARIVYVLQGPDPVSTNEPVVMPTIFPNPSSTTVSIVSPENIVSDVTISTMLGERVFAKSNVTGTTQFSTASLPIGQYIVKITNNKSTTNQILQVIR